jgi:hypothetical protein
MTRAASGPAGAAPPLGDYGTLEIVTRDAANPNTLLTFTLGDNANTFARRMASGASPKHASVEAAASIHFRGYCPAGDTCPLAQS